MPLTPQQYPLLNGRFFGWSELQFSVTASNGVVIASDTILGIKGLGYKATKKPVKVWGPGHNQPIGRTRGRVDFSGSIEIYEADDAVVMSAIQAFIGPLYPELGMLDWVFDINPSYTDPGTGLTITDNLIGCQFTSSEDDPKESDDPFTVKHELDIMRIRKNGIELVTNLLPGS